MSVYSKTAERKRIMQEYRLRHEEIAPGLGRPRPLSPKAQLEQEKRIRREIANSNERRRMQSINSGFQSLKTLLPHHGEKLSKAAILQQTAEYINNLEREKTKLMAQNAQLRSLLEEQPSQDRESDGSVQDSPPPKRKKRDTESSDEGISMSGSLEYSEELHAGDVRREMLELRCQLNRERHLRMLLEDRSRNLEEHLHPEQLKHLTTQVQMRMHLERDNMLSIGEKDSQKDRKTSQTTFNTSMSRRNLETIVEAIRHLEGDRVLFDDRERTSEDRCVGRHSIPHSEESEKESSASDQEDEKSDCYELLTPVDFGQQEQNRLQSQQSCYSDKYPTAMHLLHRPMQHQYYQRPGVIVQKS